MIAPHFSTLNNQSSAELFNLERENTAPSLACGNWERGTPLKMSILPN
jgi:hypothetical protein